MADKFEDYCKKLTLGSNSFKEIIHKKQIFVDKTDIVNKLCQRGKYKLLQRPNGFGKTILVDMLEELFLHGVKPYGDHDSYFKGLKIEKLWKDRNTYQVLRFDCFLRQLGDLVDVCSIYTDFALTLSKFAQTYGYEYHDSFSPLDNLDRILEESQENSIVFLIDDFDTPILNVCHSLSCYLETTGHPLDIVTDFLRFILLRIQDFADKFRFVFLTTSNRYYDPTAYFAQSNVKDISFNQELSNIVGFTKEEIKENYQEHIIKKLATQDCLDASEISENDVNSFIKNLDYSYGGYRFNFQTKDCLINPKSALNSLSLDYEYFEPYALASMEDALHTQCEFREDAIKELLKRPKDTFKASIKDIEKPLNFVRMNVLALLFNLGFMTIKSKNTKSYELTFVNSEAIDSLKDSFLNNDNRDLDNVFTRFNPDFRFV